MSTEALGEARPIEQAQHVNMPDLSQVWRSPRFRWIVMPLALAIGVALWIRLSFILAAPFPLNDGGMFYAMARDIQQAGYALPTHTSYNFETIPFAYPPLAFYAAAFAERVTPLDMVEVFRFLPLLFSILTIPAMFFLCRSMLHSNAASAFAVMAFVLLPRSHTWLIVGGGLTRAFGFLLAIVGIHALFLFYKRREWKYLPFAVLFGAGSALSHPEVGGFAMVTYALFFLAFGRHMRGFYGSLIAVAGISALIAPWLITVILRHGIEPLRAAAGTGEHQNFRWLLDVVFRFQFTEEPSVQLLAVLGLLGAGVAIARGHVLLLLWMAAMTIAVPRSATTYMTVPMAMLIGLSFAYLVLPGLARAAMHLTSPPRPAPTNRTGRAFAQAQTFIQAWPSRAGIVVVVMYIFYFAFTDALRANEATLQSVPGADLKAMDWIAENTPVESTVLIVPNMPWQIDKVSEWFPVIAERKSVATVQGAEWLSKEVFRTRMYHHWALSTCNGDHTLDCVRWWSQGTGHGYDYLYLTNVDSAQLWQVLSNFPDHRILYTEEGRVILHRPRPQ